MLPFGRGIEQPRIWVWGSLRNCTNVEEKMWGRVTGKEWAKGFITDETGVFRQD